ncbi:uncharacterized protein LOC129114495, partial [Anoplopoma fimbria]|uniref:uncharacterized protein LOC129114495 n=1 Tax=Anoplopoma fimbria TaxID=229290 RepID=UPI0023EDF4EF
MFYNRKLLPDSTTRTKQDSYIVHGPSNTMGYMCRVKRGDPVYETLHSHPKFVWFGDLNSSASLTVTPDRVQHFSSESLSLSCKGKSTIWKVMRFSERGILSPCHDWGTMNGSTCHIHTLQYTDAVYWCESGSEEFSNAVNITVQLARPVSWLPLVPLLTAFLTGAALIIILLLLCHFLKSKCPCIDSVPQPQSAHQDEWVNQDQTQEHIYTSPLE